VMYASMGLEFMELLSTSLWIPLVTESDLILPGAWCIPLLMNPSQINKVTPWPIPGDRRGRQSL
jgi:hypothetical protein